MVHYMRGRVKLIDLLMPQSLYGQEGNQMIFQDEALECQLKQRKHDMYFLSCLG